MRTVVNNQSLRLQLTDQEHQKRPHVGVHNFMWQLDSVHSKARMSRCECTMGYCSSHIVPAVKDKANINSVQHAESRTTPIILAETSREWHGTCSSRAQPRKYGVGFFLHAKSCVCRARSAISHSAIIGHIFRQIHHITGLRDHGHSTYTVCLRALMLSRATDISAQVVKTETHFGFLFVTGQCNHGG
jgi:hypothetical protein